jgi:hypothetical protein
MAITVLAGEIYPDAWFEQDVSQRGIDLSAVNVRNSNTQFV